MRIDCFITTLRCLPLWLILWPGHMEAQRPGAQEDGDLRGATLPYSRYASGAGRIGGAAVRHRSPGVEANDIASEASGNVSGATGRQYVSLDAGGAFVEWTVTATAQALDLRYTLPDNAAGTGVEGALSLYVNRVKVKTVDLSSYWAYQYFRTGVSDPYQTVQKKTFMRFDEVHFRLDSPLKPGDTIRLQKDRADGIVYGVDFIELEALPAPIEQPAGSLSVANFGAVPDDGQDDLAAFNACIRAAVAGGKCVYIPPGKFLLGDKLILDDSGLLIRGAGIWYTELYFSTNRQFFGGIYARASKVELADFSMNTANNTRLKYDEPGARMPGSPYKQYKGFMGTYGEGSRIHDIWVEHFECGFWIAGYDPPGRAPITRGLVISHCRIRNNYADGVNFSQGTSNSVVEYCSIRNNGDDGMAVWPNTAAGVNQPCIDDTFRNNTVENNWRAAGAAIFGGYGHQVDHNLFLDGVGGSAIRMTNDFSGFGFDTIHAPIRVFDNMISGCGTRQDIWDRPKGAIEIDASKGIYNIRFDDNMIDRSQWDAVHITGKLEQVVFRGTRVDGKNWDRR
jgi:hypothetical protein